MYCKFKARCGARGGVQSMTARVASRMLYKCYTCSCIQSIQHLQLAKHFPQKFDAFSFCRLWVNTPSLFMQLAQVVADVM